MNGSKGRSSLKSGSAFGDMLLLRLGEPRCGDTWRPAEQCVDDCLTFYNFPVLSFVNELETCGCGRLASAIVI